MRLGLCVPWDSPFVFLRFARSALNLHAPEGYDIQWFFGSGFCPARRHADACEQALAWGADLLCILGADQTYPADMLQRLVARRESSFYDMIVAAAVPFRGYVSWQKMAPFQPLAWRLESNETREFRGVDYDADMMKLIDPADGEFQLAHIIGSGVLLFARETLLALKKPWFYERVDPETFHRVADMDTKFVHRLQVETGTPLYVDTTIKVRHCHVFEIDETYQHRFLDWMNPAEPSTDRSICRFREELPKGTRAEVEVDASRV